MNKILKKTSLALAIGAVSFSAHAGTHAVDTAAITLANEIFGTGSEDTLVAVPDNTYTIDVAVSAFLGTGGTGATDEIVTVKYTLDKGAVFGEDLSDIQKWADSNATLVFTFGTAAAEAVGGAGAAYASASHPITVDQGGAIGDNTITFRVQSDTTDDTLDSVQIGGFRVKELTSALERGVANPNVRLGAEFRNVDQAVTDTQSAIIILSSQDGVELTGAATAYAEAGGTILTERPRIDVADTEVSFTGATDLNIGADAGQDFDATDNVDYVQLGNVAVSRTTYNAGADIVKKENGDDFDFQGSDLPVISLTSANGFDAYSGVYLRTTGGLCDGTPTLADFSAAISSGDTTVDISLSGETTIELEAGYNVCAVADGTSTIPEATFSAELNVTYFNPRYTDSQDTLDLGPLLRNGCQVTLFNIPRPSSSDDAFVRLTNVSELPGAVRGYMWLQDGTQSATADLSSSVAGHATAVYNESTLSAAFPEYAADPAGRHRLVLQGAFPACEALGLIRTESGVLTNMTPTTYAGDDTRLGSEQSGTSNTSN